MAGRLADLSQASEASQIDSPRPGDVASNVGTKRPLTIPPKSMEIKQVG